MQYLIGSAHELARVWKAWGVGSERDAQQPAVRQPLGPHLRHHRLGQAADDLRGELPARAKSPTTCPCWPRAERHGDGRRLRLLGWTLAASRRSRRWSCSGSAIALLDRPAARPALPARTPRRAAGDAREPARAARADARRWSSSGRAGAGRARSEAPALERFSAEPGRAAGGSSASTGATPSRAPARSSAATRWTFPNVRDAEGTVGNDYRLTGLPTTFVLDAQRAHPRGAARARRANARCGRRWPGGTQLSSGMTQAHSDGRR